MRLTVSSRGSDVFVKNQTPPVSKTRGVYPEGLERLALKETHHAYL